MNMPVLSIRQPWAWAIVFGVKDVENRTWDTPFRGRFLIHATKWKNRREYEAAFNFIHDRLGFANMREFVASASEYYELGEGIDGPHCAFGAIIGEATLVRVVKAPSSEWFEGPFGFVLRDAKRFTPIPAKGRLGFWNFNLPDGHR